MKKRGFTLTEVLGVIVILGMIALIIFPNVSKSIKNSRQKLYNQQVALIEENARKWGVEHTSLLPDAGSYYLTLNDLVTGGYVSQKELKDPRDDSTMDGCVVISYDPAYNQYKYEYTEASCTDRPDDDTVPTLTVTDYNGTVGDNVALSNQYTATYGVAGGRTTCKYEDTAITNVNYFSEAGTYAVKCIATGMNGKSSEEQTMNIVLASSGTTGSDLAEDLPELADLRRYRGANPNNWVCFGDSSITNPSSCDANHKWRIIGIDSTGRMKIMTNYYYSTGKRWDTTGGQYGSNNWGRPADLKTELNGSSFYSNNTYIDGTHRGYIINATWYTGGESPRWTYTLQAFQSGEKSKNTTGYVGLMSMTDFGYAGSGCTLSTVMTDSINACMSNNWIGYSNNQWSITPNSSDTYSVWLVYTGGLVGTTYANWTTPGVRPVVYLDSNVKITGGTGTESNPYILSK